MEESGQLHAPAALPPGKEPSPGIHWVGGLVGPRAGLNTMEKRKILTLAGIDPCGPARSTSLYELSYPGSSTNITTDQKRLKYHLALLYNFQYEIGERKDGRDVPMTCLFHVRCNYRNAVPIHVYELTTHLNRKYWILPEGYCRHNRAHQGGLSVSLESSKIC
jgi:hypothetical protein